MMYPPQKIFLLQLKDIKNTYSATVCLDNRMGFKFGYLNEIELLFFISHTTL